MHRLYAHAAVLHLVPEHPWSLVSVVRGGGMGVGLELVPCRHQGTTVVQIEMCWKCEIQSDFEDLVPKKVKHLITRFLYWLHLK